jgi:hypothetical protein
LTIKTKTHPDDGNKKNDIKRGHSKEKKSICKDGLSFGDKSQKTNCILASHSQGVRHG